MTNLTFPASSNLGIQVIDSSPFTYGNSIGGPQGLVKLGAGTLVLGVSDTFTGATTVATGVLQLGSSNSLQNSNLVTVNTAGGLTFSTSGVTYAMGGLAGNGSIGLTATGGGAVTLGLTTSSGATATFSGGLSGAAR